MNNSWVGVANIILSFQIIQLEKATFTVTFDAYGYSPSSADRYTLVMWYITWQSHDIRLHPSDPKLLTLRWCSRYVEQVGNISQNLIMKLMTAVPQCRAWICGNLCHAGTVSSVYGLRERRHAWRVSILYIVHLYLSLSSPFLSFPYIFFNSNSLLFWQP